MKYEKEKRLISKSFIERRQFPESRICKKLSRKGKRSFQICSYVGAGIIIHSTFSRLKTTVQSRVCLKRFVCFLSVKTKWAEAKTR